ncbi:MAG TPA: serine hydrolase domain-containing protein [Planctomycetota bacterium]|nr:serine hydrolase domain-containing protein [Planctomycetota bacterium]
MTSTLFRFFAALIFLLVAIPAFGAEPPPKIAPALQPFVDSHALAGAVTLVSDKDKTLDLEAVGFMDIAAQKPMQTDCIFWIASMSKPVTATALMMLVDEGKVNVDDPVEKYLPEFKGQMLSVGTGKDATLKPPAHPITVKNILTHTSGLVFMSKIEPGKVDTHSLKESVESYAKSPLKFEPDTKYQYSNAGLNTAGRIIEVVSGMPYEEFLQKRLFDPLGMKDTTFWPSDEQMKRLAKSYKPNKDKSALEEISINQCTYPLTDRKRGPSPAGGLFSTAADMGVFCRMILNNGTLDGKRYLSEAAVKQMTTPQTGEGLSGYGFGWSADKKAGGSFGHGGAYATDMHIDQKRGLITIFMVQHAGFGTDGGKIMPAFRKAAEGFVPLQK